MVPLLIDLLISFCGAQVNDQPQIPSEQRTINVALGYSQLRAREWCIPPCHCLLHHFYLHCLLSSDIVTDLKPSARSCSLVEFLPPKQIDYSAYSSHLSPYTDFSQLLR
ncbi:hypothetical protein PCASD_05075 [Puccinia coronata f. sp. avenae]|uniref:Uncharacterized protein n=1 Tax=Puccinia coronata f. sp. avenae TaxID=200324 RepID=A0A2N5VGB6_9BASI|nr:hypothetical protein PCASD_05075 [Puccinia coronata f. sp. avenae]